MRTTTFERQLASPLTQHLRPNKLFGLTTQFTAIWLGLALAGAARADYNPVPLTPGSFTQDIVIEKGAPPPLANLTTVTIDQGTNNYANTFFEQGYIPSMPMLGLPPHGTTFTARDNPSITYQMPPSYATNNCAFVGSQNIPGVTPATLQVQVPTATLTVDNPVNISAYLSILYAGGGNGNNVGVTVHYADGSAEATTINTIDWFNSSTAYAWIAEGRVAVDGSAPLNTLLSTTQTKLFHVEISLGNTASPVTGVDFAWVTNSAGASASNYRVFVFGLSGSADGSTYTPLPVHGFNADAVVEAGAPVSYVQGTTVTFEQGPRNGSYTWYEQGFATSGFCDQGNQYANPGGTYTNGVYTGLPHPGGTITSGNHTFQMPPTYTGNCCIFLGNFAPGAVTNGDYSSPDFRSGSFTILNPQPASALSILDSSGGGSTTVGYTIYFDDGTSQSGSTITVPDWFSGTGQDFVAQGRAVVANTPGLNNVANTGAGKLFHQDISLANNTASATNISFTWNSGTRTALFGVSLQPSAGGNFTPVAVSGFNADIVVEKEQPLFPGSMFANTTATMDLGTRNGNWTWFERGWVTNGAARACGLPPAGSVVNSLQDATRHYQMPASYSGPNAILIDTNHQSAWITPSSPANASAYALLTAGGSIGAANTMTNLCVLFHADGSAETNLFYGYDWFNTAQPAAFIANGRADTRFSIAGSLFANPQMPRLFETFFPLANTVSPVTNILVQYNLAGGANWTTYVLAVSATAGAVQPILSLVSMTQGNTPTVEGSNMVLTVSESGTAPITNQWQFSADGTNWINLANGGTVSGATFLSFTNASLGWTNSGQYRLRASNAAGTVISSPVTVTVYSALADITQPGDPIIPFQPNGGGSPAAEQASNAIDNLVGTNRDAKYLNFGGNGGAAGVPFVGPVGLVVSPAQGKTLVSALRIYTANDHQDRDPVDYALEGSNDGGTTWVPIAGGALNLPAARNGPGWGPSLPPNCLTQAVQEVHFANPTGYFAYRLSFTNVVDNNYSGGASMQVSEVELLGVRMTYAPVITRQPVPDVRTFVGSSPTFPVVATGNPTNLTYQWYLNGTTPIAGATGASYTLANAQTGDSGKTFSCTVMNSQGSATSASSTLTVLTAPTTPFATNVLRDSPMAWYRLDEGPDDGNGNNAVIAYDRWGGNNGVYTNVTLGRGGYSVLDSDPGTLFGMIGGASFVTAADSGVEQISGIDFAKPTNNSVAFSVEAWVKANVSVQTYDAGIVTKGIGGSEQFNLDCGGNGTAHSFRFFVRDVAGNTHGSTSAVAPEQDVWHHLVGVFDEANSNVVLYVDGLPSPAGTVAPYAGLLSSSEPASIGSRRQSANTNYNYLFYGDIDEVAIYNYALSSNQVLAHFYAAGIPPRFTVSPTNIIVSEGGRANFYASAYGTPTLHAQWYQSADSGATFSPLAGQTSMTLSLANVPAGYQGYQYYVEVTNGYGTTNSAPVSLTVLSGAPQLLADVSSPVVVYAGRTLSLQAQFGGTLPITYQWYRNGAPLANAGRISGALSNVLTIANAQTNDAGSYQVFAHNAQDSGYPVPSGVASVTVQTVPGFNNTGLGWTIQTNANGGTRAIAGNVLTLTDGNTSVGTSAFYNYPLYIGSFRAGFTYQDVGGGGADGVAFVLQNDPRGPAALGGLGGALGLSGITPSAALTFNIYSGLASGRGMSFGLNGSQGLPYHSTAPLDLGSGDPIGATVLYQGGVLSLVLTDAVAQTSFSTNITVNLPAVLGADAAYVGFTGSDGATASTQTVSNFTYVPLPTLSAQLTGANSILLTWPSSIGGYVLLQESNLSAPGLWVASPAVVNELGSQYQAVVSPTGGSQFYRLVLQQVAP